MYDGAQSPYHHHHGVFAGGKSKLQKGICGFKKKTFNSVVVRIWSTIFIFIFNGQIKVMKSKVGRGKKITQTVPKSITSKSPTIKILLR